VQRWQQGQRANGGQVTHGGGHDAGTERGAVREHGQRSCVIDLQ